MVGILDEQIALAFDVECAEVLYKAEDDRETARLVTQLAASFPGFATRVKPEVGITKKFREQTF